jgi:hypothetical protein
MTISTIIVDVFVDSTPTLVRLVKYSRHFDDIVYLAPPSLIIVIVDVASSSDSDTFGKVTSFKNGHVLSLNSSSSSSNNSSIAASNKSITSSSSVDNDLLA